MPRRRIAAIAAISVAIILTGLPAASSVAGDEVDYSAPYLVVEDGQLVTKYPAKEHSAVAAAPASEGAEENKRERGKSRGRWWLIAGFAIVVLTAGIFILQRRDRQRH